jgi:predicted nucleic acid-binding protein
MIVVSNTTPLIGLASIRRFDLLQKLFGELYIAQAVYDEAVIAGHEAGGAKQEVQTATWIKTIRVKDQFAAQLLLSDLDRGEAETIVLAYELKADWVLMDEKRGRRKLSELGFRKIGTAGLLLMAKQGGLLPVIRPDLEELRQRGFSLSLDIINIILTQANE